MQQIRADCRIGFGFGARRSSSRFVHRACAVYDRAMFLHWILDSSARRAYVGLASHVLHASGDITPREARLLFVMHAELELEVGEIAPTEDIPTLAARITHSQARAAALLELCRLAHADGEYRPDERAVLERVAAEWRASPSILAWLDAWVKQHSRLYQSAEAWILSSR